MKQSAGKGKRAWFWVGVVLVSLSALFWLLLIPAIVKKPNLGAIILFIFLTALPIGIGIYGIRRSRRMPTAEISPTQPTVQPMPRINNYSTQTVVAFPIWLWIIGGVFAAGGITLFVVFSLPDSNVSADAFALPAALLLAGFFFFFGFVTRVTFDYSVGNITIRKGFGPLTYRTRHISKKEVQRAIPEKSEFESGGPWAVPIVDYTVSISIVERKKPIKIGCLSMGRANYLADRINRFVQFE